MTTFRLALVALAVCAVLVSSPSASLGQSIFTNPITDANPSDFNPYTNGQIVVTNLTASGIGRGTGIVANAGSNRYNASSWNTSALDPDAYFTWTLTPSAGYAMDLSSLVYTGQRSSTGPNSFAFRASTDGFVGNIGTPTDTGTTLALSGAAFRTFKPQPNSGFTGGVRLMWPAPLVSMISRSTVWSVTAGVVGLMAI